VPNKNKNNLLCYGSQDIPYDYHFKHFSLNVLKFKTLECGSFSCYISSTTQLKQHRKQEDFIFKKGSFVELIIMSCTVSNVVQGSDYMLNQS